MFYEYIAGPVSDPTEKSLALKPGNANKHSMDLNYLLIRSRRRTLALYITPEGNLEVRAPLRMPERTIEDFILSKQQWIEKHRRRLQHKQRQIVPKTYAEGEEFLYLGQAYRLAYRAEDKPAIELDGCLFIAEKYRTRAEKVIRFWYRDEAELILQDRTAVLAAEMQVQPQSVRLSNAAQRWGSCSPRGVINLSWRLVMAPLDIIDYVIVHELAHLKQHNHSRAFWQVVESALPDYKVRRAWLKQNGHLLSI